MHDPNDPQHQQAQQQATEHPDQPRPGDRPSEVDPDGQQVPDEHGTGTGDGNPNT